MATVSYTPAGSEYYNGDNDHGGSGIYLAGGGHRKVRFTINHTTLSNLINGRSIESAKLTFKLGTRIWNTTNTITLGPHTSSSPSTVFPNKTTTGQTLPTWDNTSVTLYPKNATITLTATKTVKYGIKNYSGTWYIWLYDSHQNGGSAIPASGPTLTITLEDGSAYVYDGTTWKSAIPQVYADGAWHQAVAYRYNGSSWVALSAPALSDPNTPEGPEIFDDPPPENEDENEILDSSEQDVLL